MTTLISRWYAHNTLPKEERAFCGIGLRGWDVADAKKIRVVVTDVEPDGDYSTCKMWKVWDGGYVDSFRFLGMSEDEFWEMDYRVRRGLWMRNVYWWPEVWIEEDS